MRKVLVLFLLLLVSLCFTHSTAEAGPDRISITIGSKHVVAGDYEEFNPGVFLGWYNEKGHDWTTGVYRNSYGKASVAVTRGWAVHKNWSVVVGAAYYPDADQHFKYHTGNVIPIAGVRFQKGNLFIQAIPSVVVFGLTWEL